MAAGSGDFNANACFCLTFHKIIHIPSLTLHFSVFFFPDLDSSISHDGTWKWSIQLLWDDLLCTQPHWRLTISPLCASSSQLDSSVHMMSPTRKYCCWEYEKTPGIRCILYFLGLWSGLCLKDLPTNIFHVSMYSVVSKSMASEHDCIDATAKGIRNIVTSEQKISVCVFQRSVLLNPLFLIRPSSCTTRIQCLRYNSRMQFVLNSRLLPCFIFFNVWWYEWTVSTKSPSYVIIKSHCNNGWWIH